MKRKITLIIILFFCLKLSAFATYPDTLKLSSNKNLSDSAKSSVPISYTAYSIKLTTALINEYSIKLSVQIDNSDILKLSSFLIQPDSANYTFKLPAATIQSDSTNLSEPVIYADNFKSLTSGFQLDSLKASIVASEIYQDSLKQQIKRNYQANLEKLLKVNDLDSLKQRVKVTANDTLKALIYSRIAAIYLNSDTISSKKKQSIYQNEALNYTLLAIHQYSIYNDTTGLRVSFDNLATVYREQKKYSQAKWFILQSNTLSRAKNDTPNIIASLLVLSLVKSDIKDYTLAIRDLDEALQLSITTHSSKAELEILQNYAFLYRQLKNYPKEAAILKKRDSLINSIRKKEEAQLIAKLAAQNALQKKKLDSVQNKKKVYSSNIRKLYKNKSSKKIDL